MSVDPRAEMYPNMSPYNYVGNNPINNIDIRGDSITPIFFSDVKQKWQAAKDYIFGSGNDQPTNSEIYNETIALGKRLETIVDIQTAIIPGASLFDPRTSNNQKAADGIVEMAAIFIPGIKFAKYSDGVGGIAVKYSDEIVEFIQGTGDVGNKIVAKLPEGFKKIKETFKGQKVFTDGKTYISPDADGHNGGVWKASKSVEKLGSKDTRLGTYDAEFKRIGD